jgi:hypothetical protein
MRRFSTLQTLSKHLQLSANHFYILSKKERADRLLNNQKMLSPKNTTVDFLLNFSKNLTINTSNSIGNVEFYLS